MQNIAKNRDYYFYERLIAKLLLNSWMVTMLLVIKYFICKKYFLPPEKIGAKQKIVFTASQIWEMACANWHFWLH